MFRRSMVILGVVALAALFVAPAAHAAFGIEKWESITCSENVDTPALTNPPVPVTGLKPLPQDPGQCTSTTEPKFFTQAAGHPNFGITDFTLNTFPNGTGVGGFPEGFVKKIVVNTPEGLSVNPEALPQCTVEQIKTAACPPTSLVGINYLTVAAGSPTETPPCKGLPDCPQARVALPVYNLVPFDGAPSMVGFLTESGPTFIVGSLSPVDQHVIFTIDPVHAPDPGPPASPPLVGSRLVFFSNKATNINPAANGTYLTMPSNCAGGQTTTLDVESYGPPFAVESLSDHASFTTSVGATGCASVPFEPEITVKPDGPKNVDSPEPTTVDVGIPFDATKPIANSYLKVARVTLPEGITINPSSATGLQSCSDAQFHYHTNAPIECPAASKIGTVEVQTPSLPPNSLGGDVYVGQPLRNGPGASDSGEQFRIFIHVSSTRYGVNVRLLGSVQANPLTGQLTALVAENPQATFRNFRLHFFGGDKGTLTSPPTCGPNATTTQLSPWSEQADATPSSTFTLTGYPGGGSCPSTLAQRPFAPTYAAKSDSTKAGSYSPFRVNIGRSDGQQEVKLVNVTLPKGLTGKLAGIPYCENAALSKAEFKSGTEEAASPSCSSKSLIGTATTAAGSGNAPFKITGNVYLAGKYKGAPLSLAVITPVLAGPYDLGTIVVRVALNVDPLTAQVNPVSDPIPNIFNGIKLDIRSIDFNIDRKKFMINPTNCAKQATAGTINGGGSNPASSAAWSSYKVSAPFQASACNKLGFKPKFHVRLTGPTTRAKNPKIRAILEAPSSQANIARTALTLPHSLFLDNSHIGAVCTRPDLAAHTCPANSIYGFAEAKSPLLSKKLKGKVYMVPGGHTLPDLVADLRGQVEIQLHGVISSKHGGLKTVFNNTPDVPVSKFILNMKGGKKSLLVNSTNTCTQKQRAVLNIKGQNGKKLVNNRYPLNIKGCGTGR